MITYTTHGSVRGGCGHRHQHVGTALRCLECDQRDCRSVGGYSDRAVVRTDGEPLTDAEEIALEYATYGEVLA